MPAAVWKNRRRSRPRAVEATISPSKMDMFIHPQVWKMAVTGGVPPKANKRKRTMPSMDDPVSAFDDARRGAAMPCSARELGVAAAAARRICRRHVRSAGARGDQIRPAPAHRGLLCRVVGVQRPKLVIDWTLIDSPAEARRFGDQLLEIRRSFTDRTSISGGIEFAASQFERAPFEASRRKRLGHSQRPAGALECTPILRVASTITIKRMSSAAQAPLCWWRRILTRSAAPLSRSSLPKSLCYPRRLRQACAEHGRPGSVIGHSGSWKLPQQPVRHHGPG
jgi:uncharacterized protein DUF1194